jgi:hypothetical protein
VPVRLLGPLLVLALALAACSGDVTPKPADSGLSIVPLPGQTTPAGLAACGGAVGEEIPFRLHGDPATDPPVWASRPSSDERVNVTWPMGFYATFATELRVHAPDGKVMAQENSPLGQLTLPGLLTCASRFYVAIYWLSEIDQ